MTRTLILGVLGKLYSGLTAMWNKALILLAANDEGFSFEILWLRNQAILQIIKDFQTGYACTCSLHKGL